VYNVDGFADFFADVTGKMRMRMQYYKFKKNTCITCYMSDTKLVT